MKCPFKSLGAPQSDVLRVQTLWTVHDFMVQKISMMHHCAASDVMLPTISIEGFI